MAQYTCPRCQSTVENLSPVDQGLRQKFKVIQPEATLPHALCSNCFTEIRSVAGKSSTGLAREKSREDSKARLWRSRVTLLKRGRSLMKKRAFGEAIVSYEKYLKVLETVLDVNEQGLQPELFKERMATKELTIITSVYWDLMRVYDSNEKYRPRMLTTAQKLVQFAAFTPITLDIVKKAEAYKKQARNPDVFKSLIRDLMYKKNSCFIATSLFEDPADWVYIRSLRTFRSKVLLKCGWGQKFVRFYYSYSPRLAYFLDRHPLLKPPLRFVLRLLTQTLGRR